MDEVDLILHPLKSELNFPIGRKEPLDLTKNKLGNGLRWELPFFLLDAIFYATERQFPQHAVMSSQEAQQVMQKLALAIKIGGETKVLQRTPHLVVLDKGYYMTGRNFVSTNF